jgi:hypothetical protein
MNFLTRIFHRHNANQTTYTVSDTNATTYTAYTPRTLNPIEIARRDQHLKLRAQIRAQLEQLDKDIAKQIKDVFNTTNLPCRGEILHDLIETHNNVLETLYHM